MDKIPNRRRMLAALGALGAVPFVTRAIGAIPFVARDPRVNIASAASVDTGKTCVLSPAMMEGPFFADVGLNRSDLTAGTTKAGVVQGLPLILNIDLASVQAAGCVPIAGMQVDVWHADATGDYSGVGGAAQPGAAGQAFLRGYQVSDASGRVTFKTIYPGWYPGRTIHIHVKTRLFNAAGNTTYVFTSQLFFDDAVSDKVMAMPPYNARGTRNVRNAGENIYGNATRALVDLRPADGSRGYVGAVTLGLRQPA